MAESSTVAEPPTLRRADERLIRLTPDAGARARELMARDGLGDWLRVGISGGGCNGLSYKLRFATDPKPTDLLVESGGVRVLVDTKSALYLRGTVLDFSHALVGGGFKFSNPNAKGSCSCGESFNL